MIIERLHDEFYYRTLLRLFTFQNGTKIVFVNLFNFWVVDTQFSTIMKYIFNFEIDLNHLRSDQMEEIDIPAQMCCSASCIRWATWEKL